MMPDVKSDGAGAAEAVASAVRRFPRFELTVRRMMKADEAFREICEELAEAESALLATESLPAPLREVRREEWDALVHRLAVEVWEAIRRDALSRGISMP